MIWILYDKLRRFFNRIYYRIQGCVYQIGKHSLCEGVTRRTLHHSNIALYGDSKLIVEEGVVLNSCCLKLVDSQLYIRRDSLLTNVKIDMQYSECNLDNKVIVDNYSISLNRALFTVGANSRISKEMPSKSVISIDCGQILIDENNVIKTDITVRFGGVCLIGKYNCINEGSEIRCDKSITIGDYNMISYNCNIWDTNTHCMYEYQKRRRLTEQYYPNIGIELESPKTIPVKIGNDCWIGKNVSVLKGTLIEDNVVIGIGSIVSNQLITRGKIVVPKKAIVLN